MAFSSSQAQTPRPQAFEVASIHPADRKPPSFPFPAAGKITGGPGSADPGRMTYTWVPMRLLLVDAFAVPIDQIAGPDWIFNQDFRFNISANVPAGASLEEVHAMLLNFLKERFHLTYHTEATDFDLYVAVIAKGGSKLKDAASAESPAPQASPPGTIAQPASRDRDGFPQLPPGKRRMQGISDHGVMRQTFRMYTAQDFIQSLKFWLGGRVADQTGLTGKYDFTLEFSTAGLAHTDWRIVYGTPPAAPLEPEDPSGAPSLFNALEKQLGLKLEKSKTPLNVMTIDHMDRQPAEN